MNVLVVVLLSIIAVLLAGIMVQLRSLQDTEAKNGTVLRNIRRLQLNPRTRIGGPIHVQSGEVSPEQRLQRLGRASIGRRIVVGGDDDSQLNRDLTTQVEENNNG